jgi:hypothetical protein
MVSSHGSRAIQLLCSLLFGFACGVNDEPDAGNGETAPASIGAASASPSEAELIERLSAIGYLEATQLARNSQGVTLHDPERTASGLNLITSGHGPAAILMDMDGAILHEWRAEFQQVFPDHPKLADKEKLPRCCWRDVLLFPNGDLVVIWELFGIFKLDRDSRILWAVAEPVHHSLQLSESGDIVHLQAERKMIAGIATKPAIEDFIVVRDGDGRELWRLAMSDALRNVHWLRLRKTFWDRADERSYELEERGRYDPFHTNSVRLLSRAEAVRLGNPFRAGDALVSMAMLDTIAILDVEKGVTRWSQQGPFGMQHSPRLALDGGIVLFNNFHAEERSSVLTLDPRTRRVTRTYTGPKDAPLYSKRSGRIQVLPNGNTLVVETDGGRALEITADGEVVWEFHSPFRAGRSADRVAHLYSLRRVDLSRTSWLDSRKGIASQQR